MLKRIKISNYKSLVDIDLDLEPLSVLFGPNAAGKSNFLDALQLLSRIPESRTLKEAFESPYRGSPLESFTFGPDGIRDLLSRDHATFRLEADVELSPSVIQEVEYEISEMKRPPGGGSDTHADKRRGKTYIREKNLRYALEIEILPKSGILRVVDEYLAALTLSGRPKKSRNAFVEKMGNRIHLRREGQAHPMYFDVGLDHAVLSRPLYTPHYPHASAMKQELARWYFFYFEPRERMRMVNPVKEVRHIGLMGEELAAFLNTLKAVNESQFTAIEQSLKLIIPHATGIRVEVNDLGEVELQLLEGNMPVPSRLLSEGTLRVLGLLALGSSEQSPALIGFEEPENGVHPRRIKMIAEYLKSQVAEGETQLIVTTHSPVLLDLIPPRSLFAVKKDGRETQITPFETWGDLARPSEIRRILDDEQSGSPISERVLRGDFDD